MNILVIGGTGTVGRDVVAGLLEQHHSVRVLTRSQKHASNVPDDAEAVIGDLEDPSTYGPIFEDVDKMFLLNAVSPTELQQGLAAVSEASAQGIEHVVYLSVQDAETIPSAPHFAAKVGVEHAMKASDLTYTILRPNNFYQNDLWFHEAIRNQGVYPQPIGTVGLSRVDTRDVAMAAVNALTEPGFEMKTFTLAGPNVLTGPACADIYGGLLGETVSYAGDDLDTWAAHMQSLLPGWMIYDFRLMYESFQSKGLAATDEQMEETRAILGQEPRSFQTFARETVENWERQVTT